WNYRDELVRAVAVKRENAMPDAEYYQYDSGGNRLRKVTERLMYNGTQKEIEEKYYFGPYQYKKISQVMVGNEDTPPAMLLEKKTLKISGPAGLCCISHFWDTDVSGRETKDKKRLYRYQYTDVLNSVGLEANENGEILTYEEYYPYGGTAFTVAANALAISLKEYKYSGQEKDGFTGLYYYGMRYYPPWLCRWMNTDPAGTIDGLNLYTFVSGNPITAYDVGGMGKRKGHDFETPPAKRKYLAEEIPDDIPTNQQLKPVFRELGKKIGDEIKAESTSFTAFLHELTALGAQEEGKASLLFRNNESQDDDQLRTAFRYAWNSNDHGRFSSSYRAVHPGMDEHIATSMV
ncbi:MAG: RHS repeat-associated core domain-containing protein, partial [Sphingobacteriales bacterium]